MDHSLGALLAQKDENHHEQAIYYLSRTLIGAKSRYNPIEKECLEDTTLFGQPNHTCHLQSESFASSHDEARIIEFKIS